MGCVCNEARQGEPFSGKVELLGGEIAEGKVWGRGTLDTKGGLWAMLQAADELAAQGFRPKRGLYFMSSCNEECDGSGADTISRELKNRGVIGEVPEASRRMYAAIVSDTGSFKFSNTTPETHMAASEQSFTRKRTRTSSSTNLTMDRLHTNTDCSAVTRS